MISDYLVSRGIAVLSVDRRGYGFSGGAEEMQTTTKQLAEDAQAWLQELRRQPEVDSAKVGVVGHSEGAMIAMMVAAEQDVGFIVLLAPPGEPCQTLWVEQKLASLAAQGGEPATVEAVRAAFMKFTGQAASGFETDEAYYAGGKEVLIAHGVKEAEATNEFVDRILSDLRTPWMQYFLGWDPAPWLERIDEPVLAIFGALDSQVPPARNKGLFERHASEAGRARTQIMVLEDEDHFFLRREGVAPGGKHSYGRMHVSAKLLEAAAEWISRQAARPGEPGR
jgi:pimeloyl-ACP methyl ester carboxylesterase